MSQQRLTHFVVYTANGVPLFTTEPQPEAAALRALRALSAHLTTDGMKALTFTRVDREVTTHSTLPAPLPDMPKMLGVNYYVWAGEPYGDVQAFCTAEVYLDGVHLQPCTGEVNVGEERDDDSAAAHARVKAEAMLHFVLGMRYPHLLPERFDGTFREMCEYVGLRLYDHVTRCATFEEVERHDTRGWAMRAGAPTTPSAEA